MAKLIWPPEKTVKYPFSENLEMVIPAIDTDKKIKGKTNAKIEGIGRDDH